MSLLIGQEAEGTLNGNIPAEDCEAYLFTATKSGTLQAIKFRTYTGTTNCTSVVVGIIGESGGSPDQTKGIEEQTFSGTPPANAVSEVTGLTFQVTAGTKYFLFLIPLGGQLNLRYAESSSRAHVTEPAKVKKASEVTKWALGNYGPIYIAGIGPEGEAPELTSNPGTQYGWTTMAVALQLHAVRTTEYKATGLPKGLSLNSATGKITGTPTTLETTTVTITLKGGTGGTEEATASFTWIVEEGDVFPPTVLIDALARVESPISSGGNWLQKTAGEGVEGPGAVTAEGWHPPDFKGANAKPPHSYGCYWSPRQLVGAAAAVTLTQPWIEEKTPESESGENSFALYIWKSTAGYAAVYGSSPASGTHELPPGALRGYQRVQFVFTNAAGAFGGFGEVHIPESEPVEAIGISTANQMVRVWVRVGGVWRIVIRKTRAQIEAISPGVWITEAYVAMEALGSEGRAAQLYGSVPYPRPPTGASLTRRRMSTSVTQAKLVGATVKRRTTAALLGG